MRLQGAVRGLLAVTVVTVGLYIGAIGASAAGTCKVSEDAVKIRAKASTSAEVVGSTTRGATLDVIASTNDGTHTWYKVNVEGGKTGYIRGDLVSDVSGDIATEGGDSSSSQTTSNTSSTTAVEPCQYSTGSTKDQVSVRQSASTNSAKKTTASAGQALSITGQATGDDGKIWYQVSYGDVTGFIRSDFIDTSAGSELGEDEPTEPSEEEGPPIEEEESVEEAPYEEETPATTPVSDDYELRYEANDEGVEMWYLYDHIKGTRQSLDNIFAVMQQSQTMQSSDSATTSKLKTVVIVLGALIVVLIIVVTVLVFKLRDSYDDWDDEDDDDDDDEPVAKKPSGSFARSRVDRVMNQFEDDEDEDEDIRIAPKKDKPIRARSVTKPSKVATEDRRDGWQSKNFLEIDDDMEFEFLDIDK